MYKMKVNTKELQEALKICELGINSSNFGFASKLIFVKDMLMSYNDDVAAYAYVQGLNLDLAVDYHEFSTFVSKCKTKEIEIEKTDIELLLFSGKRKSGLIFNTSDDQTVLDLNQFKNWEAIPSNFITAVEFAEKACGRSNEAYKYKCVYISNTEIIGTDGFRLASYKLKNNLEINPILVNASTLLKILKFNPSEIATSESWVQFEIEDKGGIACRLLVENYVDYKSLLDFKGTLINLPSDLYEIVSNLGSFIKKENNGLIEVAINKNRITIKTSNSSGWCKEVDKCDYMGEPLNFVIPPNRLLNILKITNKAEIHGNILIFRDPDWLYLVRLQKID